MWSGKENQSDLGGSADVLRGRICEHRWALLEPLILAVKQQDREGVINLLKKECRHNDFNYILAKKCFSSMNVPLIQIIRQFFSSIVNDYVDSDRPMSQGYYTLIHLDIDPNLDECRETVRKLLVAALDRNDFDIIYHLVNAQKRWVQELIKPSTSVLQDGLMRCNNINMLALLIDLIEPDLINLYTPPLLQCALTYSEDVSPSQNWKMFVSRDLIEMLVEKGVDVNAKMTGMTALHYAVENGNKVAVDSLLRCHADYKITNQCGENALDVAIKNNMLSSALDLLDRGAQPSQRGALHRAISKGYYDVVKRLCHHSRVNDFFNGMSVMMRAVYYFNSMNEKSVRIIDELLSSPFLQLAAKDDNGSYLLHVAAQLGKYPLIFKLLAHNASLIYSIDNTGRSWIDYLNKGNEYIKNKLLDHLNAFSVRSQNLTPETLVSLNRLGIFKLARGGQSPKQLLTQGNYQPML